MLCSAVSSTAHAVLGVAYLLPEDTDVTVENGQQSSLLTHSSGGYAIDERLSCAQGVPMR